MPVEIVASLPHTYPTAIAGLVHGRGKYMVFTNYDIILREDFYVVVSWNPGACPAPLIVSSTRPLVC